MSEREEFDLWDSCERGCWLKLPLAVMRDVGPAVQTLGGILELTDKDTFRQQAEIAKRARLPIATVRKHLVTLATAGWILCKGREHTRAGRLRRTATVVIPKSTRKQLVPYGVLPWWACSRAHRFPWASRAVLSIVMGQLLTMKAVVERGDYDSADWQGELDNLGGDSRFQFSLGQLTRETGLSRESVVTAKSHLSKWKVISLTRQQRRDGGDDRDVLAPNLGFRVVKTPAGEGLCYISFREVEGGSDSGQ